MILYYILAFLSGILVKATDWIDDEEHGKNQLKYPLALLYGLSIGYLISQASFSMLFLAALFAQVFARKIDTHTHVIGFAVAIITILVLGVPPFELMFFSVFLLSAFLDELEMSRLLRQFVSSETPPRFGDVHPKCNSISDMGGKYEFIERYRPVLKVSALGFLLIGRIDFFLAIVAFDFGYVLYEWTKMKRQVQKCVDVSHVS
jgi:hypothetical protein